MTLTALHAAAVGCAIKSKELAAAKSQIVPGVYPVDVTVKLKGTLTRGADSPGGTGTAPAAVDLSTLPMTCEILRRLKVEPKQLKAALTAIVKAAVKAEAASVGPHLVKDQPDLREVFEQVAEDAQAKLPAQTVATGGRAGSTSAAITIEVC